MARKYGLGRDLPKLPKAHATGFADVWFGIKPHPIPEEAFDTAQRHWGVKLTPAQRQGVRELFRRCLFIEHRKRIRAAGLGEKEERQQQRQHKQLAKLLQQTADAWDATLHTGPIHTSMHIKLRAIFPPGFTERPPLSDTLRALAMLALVDLPLGQDAPRQLGRKPKISWLIVIAHLWSLHESAGGKPWVSWQERINEATGDDAPGDYVTPFVMGAHALMQHLPSEIGTPSLKAVGEHTRKWRRIVGPGVKSGRKR